MNIVIIDGQGGQLGVQLIQKIKSNQIDSTITAIGTNAIATSSMLKAGANVGATGENPVIVACRKADVSLGPIGIVIADSLHGEITPKMATAIGQADAKRILLPVNKCDNLVAGIAKLTVSSLIEDVLQKLKNGLVC